MPTAEQMKVQVIDGLAAIGADIRDDAIASVKALGFGHLPNHTEEMTHQLAVLFGDFGDRPRRKAEHGSDHVQSTVAIDQNREVSLLRWSKAQRVYSFQVTRSS